MPEPEQTQTFKKLWILIGEAWHFRVIGLLGLMLVGMVLETLGVGLALPAVGLISIKNPALRYPALKPWLDYLGSPSQTQLAVFGMLILAGIYTVRALFLGFLAWRQGRFIFGMHADLSQRLFTSYLRQPYTFHLQRNSAQLIRNVTIEVNMFTNAVQAFMTILTEGLVLLGITALLFLVEPFGALIVGGTLGLVVIGFYRTVRARILRWGKERQHHDGLRIQHVQQGLGGVKDIKLLGREEDFLAQYQLHNSGNARVLQHQFVLQQLPRLCLETLAVTGMAVIVLVMLGLGRPLEAVLPTLGLFGAATIRLMPSVNRIMGSFQSTRFAQPVIHTLYHELVDLRLPDFLRGGTMPRFEKQINLERVGVKYPNTTTPALKEIGLSIPKGASVGFVGDSGAGKSTLVDAILGLLSPTAGMITVDGQDIQSNLRGWQNQIGYVPQSIFLTDDTLRRNVAFGVTEDKIDDVAVRRAMRAAQMETFVNSLPQGLETVVGERGVRLSGGQLQRVGIARALYHDPPVLVLDEATSSLDVTTEQGVMDAVKALRGEKTILIVAHRLSTVAHCDRLYRMENGQVTEEGETEKVLRGYQVARPPGLVTTMGKTGEVAS